VKKDKDPVKLTAIIYDDKHNKHTAVVMVGERSYSVEVGEKIQGRIIRKISDRVIYMEGDSLIYKYDIYGKRATRKKRSMQNG